MAKLYFRYGAMNCGKSSALLQVAHNYDERDNKVILIKPGVDLKGGDKVVSRIGIERKVDYLIGPDEEIIGKIENDLSEVKCILVDEVQFFSKKQIDELFIITKMYDVPVICYGLRTDFKSNLFPGSERLMALADELKELETICRCGSKARFSARLVDGEFVSEGDQVAIDEISDVKYESLCGTCYLTKVLKIQPKNNKTKVKKIGEKDLNNESLDLYY